MEVANILTISSLKMGRMMVCTKGRGKPILSLALVDNRTLVLVSTMATGRMENDMVKELCLTYQKTFTQETGPTARRTVKEPTHSHRQTKNM